ncbi:uncharacterized protein LOC119688215, partial [Teleopsis dalmanni]|uniref:uncharacterized protein LOC119688215 n=1 Tax=Teleopsis dalmanni TaxID=139649 RepID=UPI0018CD8A41
YTKHQGAKNTESINPPEEQEQVCEEKQIGEVVKEKIQPEACKIVRRSGCKINSQEYLGNLEYVDESQVKDVLPLKDIEALEIEGIIAPNPKPWVYDNKLLAFIPPANCIAIKLDYKKPESFASVTERLQWEAAALVEANKLKDQLENGEIKPRLVAHRLVLNVPIWELSSEMTADIITQITEIERDDNIERKFSTHCKKLCEYVKLDRVRAGKCLIQLKGLKKLQLSQLMLLRHPHYVGIIRRLCRYVGNLEQWNLPSEGEAYFKWTAKLIRHDATIIYNNFKRLFNYNGVGEFWCEFNKHVKEFMKVTQNLTKIHRFSLTNSAYERLLTIKTKRYESGDHPTAFIPKFGVV